MEEYVPKIMPARSANDKSLRASPPKIIRESTTNAVEILVSVVLRKVWFKLKLTTCSIGTALDVFLSVSLIWAKITMVSFTE